MLNMSGEEIAHKLTCRFRCEDCEHEDRGLVGTKKKECIKCGGMMFRI